MATPDDILPDDTAEQDGAGASAATRDYDASQIARENWQRYRYGISRGHNNYTRLAQRLEGFYLGGDRDGNGRLTGGGQWSDDDLAILEEQGRPAYEFNEIKPAVDAAVGYQIHNRMDIAFRPRGGGATKEVADVRSKVAMQIADNNRLHWIETEVFSDGMIQQRGFFEFRMDFDDAIYGELRGSALDPMDVIPDPDAKSYDPSGWGDVIVMRWLTLDDIEGLYGRDARKRVESSYIDQADSQDFGDDDEGASRAKFGRESRGLYYDGEYTVNDLRRIKVIDRQHWVRTVMDVAIHPGGDIRPLSGDEAPEVLDHIRSVGATITRRRMKRVRWTVSTIYDVLLHDDWSPYDRFTVVPYFPYFRRGRTRGMVDNAVSPQEAANKGLSQYIHILNTTANSGWQVEEGQLTNMTTEELEESGSRTGLVIERKSGTSPLQKIQPNQVPTGVEHLIEMAVRTLKEVTVPDAMRGNRSGETSGVAIQSKQHAAQQQLAVPLDNLARTRAMVGAWIDYAISKYYDTERVFRVTKTDPETGKEIEERLVINQFDPMSGAYLNDMTAGEYDVIVTEQPMQVTFENSQYEQAIEMRKQGIAIPDQFVIKHSNLSDKFEVIQAIEGAQGGGEQQPDPLTEAEVALRMARTEKERALARKHGAESVAKSVEGMYSATQAAATIAQAPEVSTLADGLLRSAGFEDRDAPPIVPNMGAAARMTAGAGGVAIDVPSNTSPMFPARAKPEVPVGSVIDQIAPESASVGMNAGIETQEFER